MCRSSHDPFRGSKEKEDGKIRGSFSAFILWWNIDCDRTHYLNRLRGMLVVFALIFDFFLTIRSNLKTDLGNAVEVNVDHYYVMMFYEQCPYKTDF